MPDSMAQLLDQLGVAPEARQIAVLDPATDGRQRRCPPRPAFSPAIVEAAA